MRSGIASTGRIRSTAPVAIAAEGIPSYCGRLPSLPCASETPPACLIDFKPSAPSLPVPDSTTPTAEQPRSAASDVKKISIGLFSRIGVEGERRCRRPSSIVIRVLGGITWT